METHANPPRGKFLVIDGTDGSGKTVQTKLLVDRLNHEGYLVKMMDFPQYGKKACGPVEEYLNGIYGSSETVGPYKASILYAVDRYDASFEIRKHLSKGIHIVSNRYVSSNMGHQAGKISDSRERKKFLRWLYQLEYHIFEIPKPDLNIILHVPAAIARKLILKKKPREYLHGKKMDIHEKDFRHIQHAEKTYLEIASTFRDFRLVECVEGDRLLTPEENHELIWKIVENYLKN
jgi:dTMP kinase